MSRLAQVSRDRLLVIALALAAPLALNVAYLVGVAFDHLPACVPYLSGCTTTSSTGHAWPERAVFLPGMLGTAVLCGWFWRRCAAVMARSAPGSAGMLKWLGPVAAAALAAYAVCIGQPGETMRLVRRIGIDGFFLANYAGQVILLAAAGRKSRGSAVWRWMLVLCVALPVLALAGEVGKAHGFARRATNNVVEWNGILLVCAYYLLAGHYLLNRSDGRAASRR